MLSPFSYIPIPSSGLLFWPHLGPLKFMEWLPITPQLDPDLTHHIPSHGPNPSWNNFPQLQGCRQPSNITWPSHDIVQPCVTCTTSLARPPSRQTWDLRVSNLFLFNLFLSYGMLMLFLLLRSCLCISMLIPDSEPGCMRPCTLFSSHLFHPHVDSPP